MIRVDSFCPYFSCNLVDEREEKNRFVGREMNAKPNFAHLIIIYFFRLIKCPASVITANLHTVFSLHFFPPFFSTTENKKCRKKKKTTWQLSCFFPCFLNLVHVIVFRVIQLIFFDLIKSIEATEQTEQEKAGKKMLANCVANPFIGRQFELAPSSSVSLSVVHLSSETTESRAAVVVFDFVEDYLPATHLPDAQSNEMIHFAYAQTKTIASERTNWNERGI